MTTTVETKTTTILHHSVTLTATRIVELLRKDGVEIPDSLSLQVTVRVPGGGDWSNTNLDITSETPVTVEWKETRHG